MAPTTGDGIVPLCDLQSVQIAVRDHLDAQKKTISIRTETLVDLGGIALLGEAALSQYEKTPESDRMRLTAQVPTAGLASLVGET
tara:strand:- start:2683 stop:2937 length:255 start_codon:yes stop_codon:yes gene_type:complete